jgi:hypothetical protein
MLSNMLISKSRFPAPARIAVVICAPVRIFTNVVAIFFVVSGHHEQLGIGICKLGDLDTVTVDRDVSAGMSRQGRRWTWRDIGSVLWRRLDHAY